MTRSAIPTATYRLQLHKGFTFDDATAWVPYFEQLGISHLYLSPILTARAGSMHGYDVVDQTKINPELGGEPALQRLAAACHQAGLGLIIDIVPNHMAVGGADNALWLDVIENGPSSRYARYFDIDFDSLNPALANKLILPVLGDPYGKVLADGGVTLAWDGTLGKLAFAYGPHRFPLRPQDYSRVTNGAAPADADLALWRDPQALHALLEAQNFHVCWWRAAGDILNWRRFFDINELAGLRVEQPEVFQAAHAITFELYAAGIIDGVRVDHIDGLANPAAYANTLHDSLAALNAQRPAQAPQDGPYIVIEKILGAGEALSTDWPIQGTTGYDFMNQVNALQHCAAGAEALDALWQSISARTPIFDIEETAARREVLQNAFAGQLTACAAAFADLAALDLATRDLATEAFRRAITALILHVRLYRSYATGNTKAPPLDPIFKSALQAACRTAPADAACFEFITHTLAGRGPGNDDQRANAVRRLNQLTAPVAAKAVEDTAFYRYGRLLSRNDVGFDTAELAIPAEDFLASGQRRASAWPHAMLATATHDHKRGEDVRARLAVISELPDLWRIAATEWLATTQSTRPPGIALADAYMLLQMIIGAWPIGLAPDDTQGLAAYAGRLAGWQEKALREAKLRSSWAVPNPQYEADNKAWLEALLNPEISPQALTSMARFVTRIAPAGAINAVVQASLRCAWPGVPDLYQGAELWDQSLVDPDNRQPVDFQQRQSLLSTGATDWNSGAAKLSSIHRILTWRRENPDLFTTGTLQPLCARGPRAAHILAFQRRHQASCLTFAAMMHVAEPELGFGELPAASWWGDTQLQIGEAWRSAADLFTDAPVFAEIIAAASP